MEVKAKVSMETQQFKVPQVVRFLLDIQPHDLISFCLDKATGKIVLSKDPRPDCLGKGIVGKNYTLHIPRKVQPLLHVPKGGYIQFQTGSGLGVTIEVKTP